MAEQLDVEMLEMLKAKYPGYAVVAYINTTSELKTACDVCVTSSSAVKICRALDADKILFIPEPQSRATMWPSRCRKRSSRSTPAAVPVTSS